jgi:tetratricopeptide (TPR) repeat protein
MLALLTLMPSHVTSAQIRTPSLFSDNFEGGDAKGWAKSGGTRTVVADDS